MYFSNKPRKKSPRIVFLRHYSRSRLQTHTHIGIELTAQFFVASLLQAHCYRLVNDRSARSVVSHSASGRMGSLVLGWELDIVASCDTPPTSMSQLQRCELRHTDHILKTVLWSTSQTSTKNYSCPCGWAAVHICLVQNKHSQDV